jgi:hypothetical protein
MELPEPFAWAHWDQGELQGLITGFIKQDVVKYLEVDHMIVLPSAQRKFHTMMAMSEAATQQAFADGCEYIVLSILHADSLRSTGLDAWARRCSYQPYATTDTAVWYIRRRPTERNSPDHGQGLRSVSETAPSGS